MFHQLEILSLYMFFVYPEFVYRCVCEEVQVRDLKGSNEHLLHFGFVLGESTQLLIYILLRNLGLAAFSGVVT